MEVKGAEAEGQSLPTGVTGGIGFKGPNLIRG